VEMEISNGFWHGLKILTHNKRSAKYKTCQPDSYRVILGKEMQKILSQAAFTLVELLVAIAIITIISGIGIASFNSSSRANVVIQQSREIKSIARQMRTNSRAASKPTGNCTTSGQLYGAFVILDKAAGAYYSGISCFDSSSGLDYSTTQTKTLTSGVTLSYGCCTNNLIIFYYFNGQVSFFKASNGTTKPTKADLDNATSGNANWINPQPDPLAVTLSNGTSSQNYNVYFASTGLVCEQRANAATGCAQ